MKPILIFISLLLTLSAFSQQTKQQDIQNLMQLIHIEPLMYNMVQQGIEYYKKQRPAVPQQVWNDIKSNIDYSSYLIRVNQIFDSNYSQAEIKQLIIEAKVKSNKPPHFKKVVQQQLYDAGKQFGKHYSNFITHTLTAKGLNKK